MLGQMKNVKSEGCVLEQYLLYRTWAYPAAHSKAPGRAESLSVLVLLPTMVANELLMCVIFACMYLLFCVRYL